MFTSVKYVAYAAITSQLFCLIPKNEYTRSSQPFQACGPINKQTERPLFTDCTTSPLRQLLHMHKKAEKIGKVKMRKVATSKTHDR